MSFPGLGRGTAPISDWRISYFIRSLKVDALMRSGDWNPHVRKQFLTRYREWIESCSLAPVRGLGAFSETYYMNGVTEAYDLFFSLNGGRRFRTIMGEYPYTRLSMPNWLPVEAGPIEKGDAVTICCPSYADGGLPRNFVETLDQCKELDVPVFVDAAYFGTCCNTEFDFSHPAISMLGFSLSKTFSAQSFRIGMVLTKEKMRGLEEIQVSSGYFNKIGAAVGLELMNRYSADFIPENYATSYQQACRDLSLEPGHCVMLALVKDGDTRFDDLLADNRFDDNNHPPSGVAKRICISKYLATRAPLHQRILSKAPRIHMGM